MNDWDLIKEARAVSEGKLVADPIGLVRQLGEALRREGEEKHQQEARAKQAEEKLAASGEHCATCVCGRRAPVQGYGGREPGTVAWEEHCLAWTDYARRYGNGQTAERMAQRGGFEYWEITGHLGHEPKTWKPR